MRVAWLRGVNVGGRHRIAMAELRAQLDSAGFGPVATYIQSGNVVFGGGPADETDCAEALARHIETAWGFRCPVVVRTAEETRAALHAHPFDDADAEPKLRHLVFADRVPDPESVAGLDPDRSPPDRFVVDGRTVHVCFPSGSARSKLTIDWFESQLGVTLTGRNVATVRAVLDLATEDGVDPVA